MSEPNGDRTIRLADLARELNVDYRALRSWVNRRFPRAPSEGWHPWVLGAAQAKAATDHFAGRDTVADPSPPNAVAAPQPFAADWYWEGNVIAALASALTAEGWIIRRTADAGRREQGVDLLAESSKGTLMVEVKGYPTTTYARGPKAGQPKPTSPVSQARQWFSHAMLECLLMRANYPDAGIGMAFPDMPTYARLIERVRPSLVRLGFGVYVVSAKGSTRLLVPPQIPR